VDTPKGGERGELGGRGAEVGRVGELEIRLDCDILFFAGNTTPTELRRY
jgi:hypothetical protein